MAGCVRAIEGLASDLVAMVRRLHGVGFLLDYGLKGPDDLRNEEIRATFDKVLTLFTTEISPDRVVVPTLGDGTVVDLFKLCVAVRGKGGYKAVSRKGYWASVVEEIGLVPAGAMGPAVKLIYKKYVKGMEKWFDEAFDREEKPKPHQKEGKKDGVNGVVHGTPSQEKRDPALSPLSSGSKCEKFLTNGRSGQKLDFDDGNVQQSAANGEYSRKRKRDNLELEEMVNWVKSVAKKPVGLSVRNLYASRDKYHGHAVSKLCATAFSARKVMFCSEIDGKPVQEVMQRHFSILEGYSLDYLIEKDQKGGKKGGPGKVSEGEFQGAICLGDKYQAEVLRWTGKSSETSIFDNLELVEENSLSPKGQLNGLLYEQNSVGNGRQESCHCQLPGSVQCVRLHVADKRFQLMRELGPTFNSSKFNHMGDDVALSWTEEEQRLFKLTVRDNPPSEVKCWGTLCSVFPHKGMKNIMNYYYNVFIPARRAYQNRVIPKKDDTDDDSTDYDFLALPYGHHFVRIQDTMNTFCVQNSQCMDVDDHPN